MSAWRVVVTDTERPSGIAPVCPQQAEPGGPHDFDPEDPDESARYDTGNVYDCCPGPHIECWQEKTAETVAAALTAAEAEVCS